MQPPKPKPKPKPLPQPAVAAAIAEVMLVCQDRRWAPLPMTFFIIWAIIAMLMAKITSSYPTRKILQRQVVIIGYIII